MLHVAHLVLISMGPLAAPDFTNLFAAIGKYIVSLIAAGAALFLLIDLMGHLFRTPRDLRAAGIEIIIFVILLAVINKADAIVKWGLSLV